MPVLNNSFGTSVEFNPRISNINYKGKMSGSSLNRKENPLHDLRKDTPLEKLLKKPLSLSSDDDCNYQVRTLSPRSRSKIRRKVLAFSRLFKRLTFVTLTFVNEVSDREAIAILGASLDNVSKRCNDFQYLWVVERQSKNKEFKNNVHFHIITNNYWEIKRWWTYWLDVQTKYGILPRKETFKPSSAFDVKVVKSNNIKGVGNYITKYVTKNDTGFRGMLWSCSRKISRLYTGFYSEIDFLDELLRLQEAGILKGKIKSYPNEFCKIHLIPLNNATTKLYNKVDDINKKMSRPLINWTVF